MALRLAPRLALRATLPRASAVPSHPASPPASLASLAFRALHPVRAVGPNQRVAAAMSGLTLRRFSSAAPVARPAPSPPAFHSPPAAPRHDPDPHQDSDADSADAGKSAYARFKALTKKYGSWAVGVYLLLSSVDFTLTFLLVHSLGADRFEPLVDAAKGWYRTQRYGADEAARLGADDTRERDVRREEAEREEREGRKRQSGWRDWVGPAFWAEVAVAYTIHKTALLPVRAGLTAAWTPKLVGWLTKRGWVGKGGLTRAASHAGGKVRTASDRMKDRVKRET